MSMDHVTGVSLTGEVGQEGDKCDSYPLCFGKLLLQSLIPFLPDFHDRGAPEP